MPTRTRSLNWLFLGPAISLIAVISLMAVGMLQAISQAVGGFDSEIVSKLSREYGSREVLQLLGIGIASAVLMLQALIANRRAKAMEEASAAQAGAVAAHATANLNTEKGQRQERLKNAIEHLGSDSGSVRLGGAYELFHLAQETESLRQTVLDILCAHIRRTTSGAGYRDTCASKPSEEIASLLAQLFIYGHDVFLGCRIHLRESRLNGADLRGARLAGADLQEAHLERARLEGARLEGSELSGAHLREAQLGHACLRGASLYWVDMRGASLASAQLQGAGIQSGCLAGANVRGGWLQCADLGRTQMYGVDLRSASLAGANLAWAEFQGAILDDADLRGAGCPDWSRSHPFAERVRISIGRESTLSNVHTGGLTKKRLERVLNDLDSLMTSMSLEHALRPYIGEPDRLGLQEGHGAILGAYGGEEAAAWIAEHESALAPSAGLATRHA